MSKRKIKAIIDETINEKSGLAGFYRVQIDNGNGKIVGDSGWKKNLITNSGMQYFLAKLLGKTTGSSQIGYVGLGTGALPATNATSMTGDITGSTKKTSTFAVGYSSRATSTDADTIQFAGTFQSSDNFLAAASTLQCIGLFAESAASAVLFSAGTYATSQCSTNQNVNFSYQVRFTAS
jgi:hypothetical protein